MELRWTLGLAVIIPGFLCFFSEYTQICCNALHRVLKYAGKSDVIAAWVMRTTQACGLVFVCPPRYKDTPARYVLQAAQPSMGGLLFRRIFEPYYTNGRSGVRANLLSLEPRGFRIAHPIVLAKTHTIRGSVD